MSNVSKEGAEDIELKPAHKNLRQEQEQEQGRQLSITQSQSAEITKAKPVTKEELEQQQRQKTKIASASSSTEVDPSKQRQVIAVSASKNPTAFFNLARRFLITDEFCDLSALEGAIVSAVDAAHLLERSKLAKIVRIQTSYVSVEPRRKSQQHMSKPSQGQHYGQHMTETVVVVGKTHPNKKGNPLRRSRIIITVQRTEDYRNWLDKNDMNDPEDHHHGATSFQG